MCPKHPYGGAVMLTHLGSIDHSSQLGTTPLPTTTSKCASGVLFTYHPRISAQVLVRQGFQRGRLLHTPLAPY